MAKQTQKRMDGLNSIAAGYYLLAVILFAMQFARIFVVKSSLEYASLAAETVGWLLILWGFNQTKALGTPFFKGFIAGAVGLGATLLEAFVLHRNLARGMEEGAYIDFTVLFFFFLTRVMLVYAFAKILEGAAPWILESGKTKKSEAAYRRAWLYVAIVLFLSLFLVQLSAMFSRTVWITGVLLSGAAGFLATAYMGYRASNIYKACKSVKITTGRRSGKFRKKTEKKGPDTVVLDKEARREIAEEKPVEKAKEKEN